MRSAAVIATLIALSFGWFFRWETIPISNGNAGGALYMLNRWTGALYVVYQDERLVVKEAAVTDTGAAKKPATFSFEEATAPAGPDGDIKYRAEDKPVK